MVASGLLTHRQVRVWKDDFALFSHGVAAEPMSGVAQTNMASLYRLRGDDDLALHHYEKALRLDASHFIVYYNMAAIYRDREMFPRAIEACRMSLRIYPDYARSHHLLGELLESRQAGEDEALAHLERAFRIEPWNGRFAISLALANASRGRFADADRVLRDVLEAGSVSPRRRERIVVIREKLAPYLGR